MAEAEEMIEEAMAEAEETIEEATVGVEGMTEEATVGAEEEMTEEATVGAEDRIQEEAMAKPGAGVVTISVNSMIRDSRSAHLMINSEVKEMKITHKAAIRKVVIISINQNGSRMAPQSSMDTTTKMRDIPIIIRAVNRQKIFAQRDSSDSVQLTRVKLLPIRKIRLVQVSEDTLARRNLIKARSDANTGPSVISAMSSVSTIIQLSRASSSLNAPMPTSASMSIQKSLANSLTLALA